MDTADTVHDHPIGHSVVQHPVIAVDEVSVLTRVSPHAWSGKVKWMSQTAVIKVKQKVEIQ